MNLISGTYLQAFILNLYKRFIDKSVMFVAKTAECSESK